MPIYEYECEDCGNVEEVLQNFSDEPKTICNHCNGKLHKLISQSTFHLKGTGWYVTDYAKGKRSDNQKAVATNKETKKSEKTTEKNKTSE
ncbi:FmdB family transcriptional regulator [Candidatus Magnetomoraceae bacterium gMMP-15]